MLYIEALAAPADDQHDAGEHPPRLRRPRRGRIAAARRRRRRRARRWRSSRPPGSTPRALAERLQQRGRGRVLRLVGGDARLGRGEARPSSRRSALTVCGRGRDRSVSALRGRRSSATTTRSQAGTCASCSPAIPARGERLVAEAAASISTTRRTGSPTRRSSCSARLADESGLAERRDAMFRGERINVSEDRSVLHVALRMPRERSLIVDGVDVVAEVHEVLDRMGAFADRVREGEWRGHTGKPIRNVVNIGIGGSDLGPVMAYEALRHYARRELTFRFVSNVDGTDFAEATRDLDPAETLFIVSSKTFTTLETMTNARTAREWALAGLGGADAAVSPSTSSRSRRTPRAWPSSASTPRTCSASGTGSAAATRWTPPSGCRRCSRSARGVSLHAGRVPRRRRALPRGADRAQPAGADGPPLRLVRRVLRRADRGRAPLRPVPAPLPRLPAAADHGVEREARHARRRRGRLPDRRDLLGRARHQRPALLLPAPPPGNGAVPVRLHRLHARP